MTLNYPNEDNPCLDLNIEEMLFFKSFLQGMVNRSIVGGMRYGPIQRKKKYLTRMKKELSSYEKEGNMEQLLNVAVYCYLESYSPENKKFHFDSTVKSVTRGSMGL